MESDLVKKNCRHVVDWFEIDPFSSKSQNFDPIIVKFENLDFLKSPYFRWIDSPYVGNFF